MKDPRKQYRSRAASFVFFILIALDQLFARIRHRRRELGWPYDHSLG